MMKLVQPRTASGFTLIEIMFVVSIMAILSGTVMTTFLCLNRAAVSVTDYRSTHAGARRALTVISDDIRAARNVSVPALNSLLLTRQGAEGRYQVNYSLEGNSLRRNNGAVNRIICDGVNDMQIGLMTREGKPVSESSSMSMVSVTLKFVESRMYRASTNTFSIVTAVRNAGSP